MPCGTGPSTRSEARRHYSPCHVVNHKVAFYTEKANLYRVLSAVHNQHPHILDVYAGNGVAGKVMGPVTLWAVIVRFGQNLGVQVLDECR